jgi:transposase-like protein
MEKKIPNKADSSIIDPRFQDEDKAREFIEALRWPDGAVCPHCGALDHVYKLTSKRTTDYQDKSGKWRKPRKGLWKCGGCRKQFTVTVGTIFEDGHIPLHKWLLAIHLMCSSKKGISAHQLMRNLGIGSYKSAWFLAHRIRYGLTSELTEKLNGVVECDETYIGGRRKDPKMNRKAGERAIDRPSPFKDKAAVFAMVERGGRVVSRHVERVTAENLKPVLESMVSEDARLMTDTGRVAQNLGGSREHHLVNHSADEYVRYEEGICITTNTIESYFAILKRGINGVFHHVGRNHLHRYLRANLISDTTKGRQQTVSAHRKHSRALKASGSPIRGLIAKRKK